MSIIQVSVILISFFTGLFVYFNPLKTINIQKKFYELINWRIEPISVSKEIRNTRIMGAMLVLLAVFSLIYISLAGCLNWFSV